MFEQTLFHSADVELGETVGAFLEAVEDSNPSRVVFDSTAELRLLAGDTLRYRRQMLGLRQFFSDRACTVLLLEDMTDRGDELSGLLDGAFGVRAVRPRVRRRAPPPAGGQAAGRRLFAAATHNFAIRTGGLEVYPRLVTSGRGAEYGERDNGDERRVRARRAPGRRPGGGHRLPHRGADGHRQILGLDALRLRRGGAGGGGGGVPFRRAPRDLLSAQHGAGHERAALGGGRACSACRGWTRASSRRGEFAQRVRKTVEDGAKVIVIDSLTGYFHAMPQEDQLITQMHELLTYLSQRGVLSLLVVSQHGIVGTDLMAPVDVSYMGGTPSSCLRHFEAAVLAAQGHLGG